MSKLYYAVIGRVPDGRNETHFFESNKRLGEELEQMFSDALWEGLPKRERKSVKKGYGGDFIIDAVFVSKSKIERV